jgi:hypothetical protein
MISEHSDDHNVPARHRWTVADRRRMAETGLLPADARVELIHGDLFDMLPITPACAGRLKRLLALISPIPDGQAVLAVRDPLVLDEHNELHPDLALLRWREDFYEQDHPRPADVLLIVEITDRQVDHGRTVKIPLYARHHIPEVWLLDLGRQHLESYRHPEHGDYRQVAYHLTGEIAPERLPELTVQLEDLLPVV